LFSLYNYGDGVVDVDGIGILVNLRSMVTAQHDFSRFVLFSAVSPIFVAHPLLHLFSHTLDEKYVLFLCRVQMADEELHGQTRLKG
jgi:hypothetical protein